MFLRSDASWKESIYFFFTAVLAGPSPVREKNEIVCLGCGTVEVGSLVHLERGMIGISQKVSSHL